ncbi:MAG: GLUG motif-containing protein, partial [Novosphingobium sp.]
MISVRIGGSDTGVVNAGTVRAAQVEMRANGGNVYALAGNTDAVIKATGVASSDGRIFLTAGDDGTVRSSAQLTATTGALGAGRDGGQIAVTGGTVDLAGSLDVSATGSGTQGGTVTALAAGPLSFSGSIAAEGGEGGRGGFVETSGASLAIADTARVTTLSNNGLAGTWLIDPNDLTIAASGGDITGATIATNLAGGNVVLSSNDGAASGNGDIFVNDAINWSANTTLTLSAVRNIAINNDIAASGASAGLALTYGGNYSFGNGGRVTLSGASATFAAGGTSYTLIHDAAALQNISGSGNYALAGDIDASGTSAWNSGAGFAPISGFNGSLIGLNHAINSLTIQDAGSASVGMFTITGGAFRDFTLSNISVVSGGSAGALAYRLSNGSVSNLHVTGSVESVGAGGQVGGLIGWSDQGQISGSSSAATVIGFGEVGGLVGRLRVGSISNSYATGAVTGTSDYVGGLVGSSYQGGTLTNVYASGAVSGTTNVGGLVGGAVFAGTVTANNAYWDTDSTGQSTSYAGTGISNANAYTQATYPGFDFTNTWVMTEDETRPMLRNEYAKVIFTPHALQLMSLDLSASYRLGADLDMTRAFTASGGTYGDIWGTAGFVPVGTFLGSFDGQSHTITDLTINRGSTNAVGLFRFLSGTVSDVGLIGGSFTGSGQAGTLVGVVNGSGSVTRSYSTSSLTASGNFAGGLVGQNSGTISLSYAGGAVTSTASSAGGFVGVNDGTISDSYATGAVSATTYAGGFAGGNRAILTHVYATGLVTGSGTNGGLTPYNIGTVTQSYWDTQTSGVTSGNGTGLTTAQLQGTLPTGFSGSVWGTGAYLYPYFAWQYATTPVAVSGFAYSDAGTLKLPGAGVTAISAGAAIGSATTGANGYYYILAKSGSIASTGALSYLDGATAKGAGFADVIGATGVQDLDIYGSALRLSTGAGALSGTRSNYIATLGSYSDTDISSFLSSSSFTSLTTAAGYGVYLSAGSGYSLDTSLASAGLLSLTGGGTFSVSGTVELTAAGALSVNGPVSWG